MNHVNQLYESWLIDRGLEPAVCQPWSIFGESLKSSLHPNSTALIWAESVSIENDHSVMRFATAVASTVGCEVSWIMVAPSSRIESGHKEWVTSQLKFILPKLIYLVVLSDAAECPVSSHGLQILMGPSMGSMIEHPEVKKDFWKKYSAWANENI